MMTRILIVLLALTFTGCTSFRFDGFGMSLRIEGAPPTLWKAISKDESGFDLFHFESLTAQQELDKKELERLEPELVDEPEDELEPVEPIQ